MKLKSFGCSFIFGSDLSDIDSDSIKHSKLTWPACLAKYLDLEYECYARPGSGNLQIMEQVLNQLHNNEPAVFVIGWTWIDRFDYGNPQCDSSSVYDFWNTIMPGDNTDLASTYYKHLHSEYQDKLVNLGYISLTLNMLRQKNITFVMTYMDKLLFDQRWHVSSAVIDLQNYVKPYMTTFEQETFLDWSRKKRYAESQAWHPLEQAHAAAADYIVTVFDKQKTNDPVRPVLS